MTSHPALFHDADPLENSFGPVSSTRDFDFTLTFEQSILSILPSSVLLVGRLRLLYLFRDDLKTFSQKNYFYLLKLVLPFLPFI